MEIKKFWKLYPVSKKKKIIANERIKVSKKKENKYKNLVRNILMV